MIKSEMGSVSMRGTTPVLISELALAMKSLRESLAKRYKDWCQGSSVPDGICCADVHVM